MPQVRGVAQQHATQGRARTRDDRGVPWPGGVPLPLVGPAARLDWRADRTSSRPIAVANFDSMIGARAQHAQVRRQVLCLCNPRGQRCRVPVDLECLGQFRSRPGTVSTAASDDPKHAIHDGSDDRAGRAHESALRPCLDLTIEAVDQPAGENGRPEPRKGRATASAIGVALRRRSDAFQVGRLRRKAWPRRATSIRR
jgi:hypothetical protein